VARRHAVQQFNLNLGTDRPVDPNRECPKVLRFIDLDFAAGPDDANDHARVPLNICATLSGRYRLPSQND
jgi:hypothetical protein